MQSKGGEAEDLWVQLETGCVVITDVSPLPGPVLISFCNYDLGGLPYGEQWMPVKHSMEEGMLGLVLVVVELG